MNTDPLRVFAEHVQAAGGRALLIGGAVRDRLLSQTRRSRLSTVALAGVDGEGGGLSPTDLDVEVYGLPPDRVEQILGDLGDVREVGKAFGVLLVQLGPTALHVSLPRRESKVAPGHRGFAVDTDPSMTPEDAARRRDFTINAIAEDPLTGEMLDPVGGRRDLEAKLLRVVDADHFGEDPLRVLRAAVFVAQFALHVDPATDRVIRQTVPSLHQLPRERVGAEWEKLLLRPTRPSLGVKLLMEWGVLEALHPDFVLLTQTPQHPPWHPEGDVWTHTLLVIDEAARITRAEKLEDPDRWHLMVGALCHDLGKATTTRKIEGIFRSIGHDAAGIEPTRRFLRSIAADHQTVEIVVRLVREHLLPLRFFTKAAQGTPLPDGEIRALARRLQPATIVLLTLLADADHRGRGPFPDGRAPARDAGAQLRERAERLGVLHGPPASVLRGEDLVQLGLPPGPAFGDILRRADELRDEREWTKPEILSRLQGAVSTDDALARLRT